MDWSNSAGAFGTEPRMDWLPMTILKESKTFLVHQHRSEGRRLAQCSATLGIVQRHCKRGLKSLRHEALPFFKIGLGRWAHGTAPVL